MDSITYVRGKLEEVARTRGGVALVASKTKIDRRTVRAVLDPAHRPNIGTITTLDVYFRKEAKKQAKEAM